VEIDARAARDTGRPAPAGYTGFEDLLNYVIYQAQAINQFDQIGHMLQVVAVGFQAGPCGQFNAGAGSGQQSYVPNQAATGPTDVQDPAKRTTSAADRNPCVSWLGPTQPGINAGPHLPPYDPSVCPHGSSDLSLCNPAGPRKGNVQSTNGPGAGGPAPGVPGATPQPGAPAPGGGGGAPQLPNPPKLPHVPNLPHVPGVPNVPNLPGGLGGLLGIGGQGQGSSGGPLGGTGGGTDQSNGATNDLLNFLFGA
jgi:hypothetical protein